MRITEKKRTLINTLRTKNIHHSILLAIEAVPRELFVESDMVNFCYDDNALPIACSQTISQPYTVAYMTQLLDIKPTDKILEIGTGSGYQTAILHHLCKNIYTIERIQELADSAYLKFKKLNMKIYQKIGDGSLGWIDYAPFTKIIVTAGATEIPINLIQQLDFEGKMVIPVGGPDFQDMLLLTKSKSGKLNKEVKDRFRFVPLISDMEK